MTSSRQGATILFDEVAVGDPLPDLELYLADQVLNRRLGPGPQHQRIPGLVEEVHLGRFGPGHLDGDLGDQRQDIVGIVDVPGRLADTAQCGRLRRTRVEGVFELPNPRTGVGELYLTLLQQSGKFRGVTFAAKNIREAHS